MNEHEKASVRLHTAPSLTERKYEDMTLPELLETRDKLIENKKEIHACLDGVNLFKFAMGRLQTLIYNKRTQRKSGLVIPYNKDINYE